MRAHRFARRVGFGARPTASTSAAKVGQTVFLGVDDPFLASRLARMLQRARVPVSAVTGDWDQQIISSTGRPIAIIGSPDPLRAVEVVRRLRGLRCPIGIVVCMDDVRLFDETFEAGADAWVSSAVEPDALAVVLKSVGAPIR